YVLMRKYKAVLAALIASGVLVTTIGITQHSDKSELPFEVIYQCEGILGQVSVIDFMDVNKSKLRSLLINAIPQNLMIKKHMPFSKWSYIHRIATLTSNKPKNSKVLLIGLAGGNLAMELKGLGFQVDAVELDKRMPFVAEEYFGFTSDSINIIIDDGRHYINNTNEIYDIIIVDVLTGEVQPQHLFTKEAMENLKRITHSDALVMFNLQGFFKGKDGLAARSIYKTLLSAGFKIKYNANLDGEGKDGDILFIASHGNEPEIDNINESRLNLCCKILAFEYSELITNEVIEISDASILTDNKPLLEKMNVLHSENWRAERIESYSIHLAKNSFSLFK
ncbi:spermidine synthase, partial [Bacteroidota bacterium]